MSKIKSIYFKNYKAFAEEETLELRPITLIVGKNSSGKSSILKLLSILQSATTGAQAQLKLNNQTVSLGSRYEDLFHNYSLTNLILGVNYEDNICLKATYIIDKGILYRYNLMVNNGTESKIFYINKDGSEQTFSNGLFFKEAFDKLNISAEKVAFSMDYIGPIRHIPERTITFSGFNGYDSVGYDGGLAYPILLDSYLQDKTLFNRVSDWMNENLEGQKLSIEQNSPTSGTYSFFIERNNFKVNIADVGQGVSQVLPIIVESFMDNQKDVVAIEQPELHIHPADHANVAYRLAESAKKTGKKFVIESHSENFLLGLRNLVSDQNTDFTSDDVLIYFVENDEESAYLDKIEIGDDGHLTKWPEGVFGESFDLLSQIMNNQREK